MRISFPADDEGDSTNQPRLTFDDEFDSGNLKTVAESQRADDKYLLYIRPDAFGTEFQQRYTTWFHFRVTNAVPGMPLTFVIMNMAPSKMFSLGFRPVYRNNGTNNEWRPIPSPTTNKRIPKRYNSATDEEVPAQLHLTFTWTPDGGETYFAYCYPHSYTDCQTMLDGLEHKYTSRSAIEFHRELMIASVEGRRVDLVTVTSKGGNTGEEEARIPGLFPGAGPRPPRFDKPVVLISARVHPAETPGTHILNGALHFILSMDPRASLLRSRYVFMFVPMLNPDGVCRGHYRTDSFGRNLNRYYGTATREEQPTIWAMTALAAHLQETGNRLHTYIDLHAHANKRGCFMYGNHFDDDALQLETMLLPRLVAMNSADFDFDGCCFSAKMMSASDKAGMSRTGTSRVGMAPFVATPMAYTLEANYYISRSVNPVRPVAGVDPGTPLGRPRPYTPAVWGEVGRGVLLALLDYHCKEPDVAKLSRVSSRPSHATLDGVRESIRCHVANRKRKKTSKRGSASNTDVEDDEDD
ncbi:Zinc carboxypeptidase [Carpediemonas membranifera]|uniref:Cytosolic carboxypeptidase-like protein 5 n=1 Tax=Carpediemonas membranifera TaxID=201153 RepID=A0A8J6DZ34_9EUKA|nr:Zinc carboxypeptidase [Carpediemonas membranifera]|eukprot:KAG9390188.1 Zinc carboxypeptidase [Carpediemonas membranifera]